MKNKDAVIAALADQIVSGGTPGLIALATVLDATLDEPLVSNEDAAMLISGDMEQRLDILRRIEQGALAAAAVWLDDSPRGKALVAERMERERDEEEERLHEADLAADADEHAHLLALGPVDA